MSHASSRRALWMQKFADQVTDAPTEKIRAGTLAPGDLTSRGLPRPRADGAPGCAITCCGRWP
ncbi:MULTISPECIES: hypothetical protein [unclassified Mameliella]|uniref:hypothetical protein n=1 Tax=unclassified Mameliella TaxID=2630630 RepID=UPI00273D9851|nr:MULTISPECIES: hypothetical protein [unclassified Mameliella]